MTITPASLAARHGLGDTAVTQFEALLQCLAASARAPTTVTERDAALRDHLADSLIALDLPVVRTATAIADLGAGAGFPGLPLAIALPSARVGLVESNRHKCDFISATASACGAATAYTVQSRIEEWGDGLGALDLAVVRALAPLPVVAEYAAPLLRIRGALVAWRGRRDPEDEQAGARAAEELGLEVSPPIQVRPYPEALHRHLHVMIKRKPTPERFPRRAGVARRRPLGRAERPSDRQRR